MKKTTLTLAVLVTSVILASCCSQEAPAPPLRPMPTFTPEPTVVQEVRHEPVMVYDTK